MPMKAMLAFSRNSFRPFSSRQEHRNVLYSAPFSCLPSLKWNMKDTRYHEWKKKQNKKKQKQKAKRPAKRLPIESKWISNDQ